MVLLVFWKVKKKKKKKKKKLPNRETCFNGHDIYMGVKGIVWGAWWCGFYLGRLGVTVAG